MSKMMTINRHYVPNVYHDNARLAVDLALELGAKGTHAGTMSNFCKTEPEWRCPGCRRSKKQIARLNKHGEFFCAIHLHHDHIGDRVAELVGHDAFAFIFDDDILNVLNSFHRFQKTYICMDCNLVDAHAKRKISAPKFFSFSPAEIAEFAIAMPRAAHKVNEYAAGRVLALALPEFNKRSGEAADHLRRFYAHIFGSEKKIA